jgi:hypothetical protein
MATKKIHGVRVEDHTRHGRQQPKPPSGKRREPTPQKPKKPKTRGK